MFGDISIDLVLWQKHALIVSLEKLDDEATRLPAVFSIEMTFGLVSLDNLAAAEALLAALRSSENNFDACKKCTVSHDIVKLTLVAADTLEKTSTVLQRAGSSSSTMVVEALGRVLICAAAGTPIAVIVSSVQLVLALESDKELAAVIAVAAGVQNDFRVLC